MHLCVHVRAMLPVDLGKKNEDIVLPLERCKDAAQGAGWYKPALPRAFQRNCAATVTTAAAVLQRYNSTSASKSGLLESHGAIVFMYVCSVFTRRYFYSRTQINHDQIHFHVQF